MVTDDTRPCGNPTCWCRKDKVEPAFTVTATDKYPMTVEWDQYGNVTIKDEPLGGFDKDKPKEPKNMFDLPSGKPLAAFFYDEKTPSWDENWGSRNEWPNNWYNKPTGETRETDPVTGGEKGKKLAELGAIDPASLLELAKVAGYGSGKYARLNYMKGYKWSLSYDAMQRHLLLFWNGESFDPESGLHHLAHAAWHCMTLMSYDERELGTDDRYEADW